LEAKVQPVGAYGITLLNKTITAFTKKIFVDILAITGNPYYVCNAIRSHPAEAYEKDRIENEMYLKIYDPKQF
jgi:hypothetical protein